MSGYGIVRDTMGTPHSTTSLPAFSVGNTIAQIGVLDALARIDGLVFVRGVGVS